MGEVEALLRLQSKLYGLEKHASKQDEDGDSGELDVFGCSQSLGRPLGLHIWSTVLSSWWFNECFLVLSLGRMLRRE
jgi:hypothetical protein